MMRHGFSIRLALATDLEEVLWVERAVAEAPHWKREEYAEILQGAGGSAGDEGKVERCLLVAQSDDGQIVGFAVAGLVRGTDGAESWGELESVAVTAKERRNGVGKALCEALVLWCEGRGAAAIDLEVRAGSAGALAMYRGLGFAEVGRRRGYYHGPGEDAVLMRRQGWASEMRGRGDGCGGG